MKFFSRFFISCLFILNLSHGFAQTTDPTFKIFLIGDAGETDTTGATLYDLGVKLRANPNSAVVFLGDNCYSKSLRGLVRFGFGGYDGGKVAKRRIMAQLDILRGYQGHAYFVPGNHDWWNKINIKQGKKLLLKEQLFIEDSLRTFTSIKNHNEGTFLPSNGHPGPISKEFNGGKTRIIFIDSYRLIIEEHGHKKKHNELLEQFYKELKEQLTEGTKKRQKIIVVAHHPIRSKGSHSQTLALWERLSRRFGDNNANYPPYKRMAMHLDSLLKEHQHPEIYYAAGHEHSLEYFFNDSLHYIVSGAGSRVSKVDFLESCQDATECLQWNVEGFFEIVFYGRQQTVLMHYREDNQSEMKVLCVTGCD